MVIAKSSIVTAMIVVLLILVVILVLISLMRVMLGHVHAHLVLLMALPVEKGSMLILLVVLTKHAVCGGVCSG